MSVIGEPDIVLKEPLIGLVGEEHKFSVLVYAFPQAAISWSFEPCNVSKSQLQCLEEKHVVTVDNIETLLLFLYLSSLNYFDR